MGDDDVHWHCIGSPDDYCVVAESQYWRRDTEAAAHDDGSPTPLDSQQRLLLQWIVTCVTTREPCAADAEALHRIIAACAGSVPCIAEERERLQSLVGLVYQRSNDGTRAAMPRSSDARKRRIEARDSDRTGKRARSVTSNTHVP